MNDLRKLSDLEERSIERMPVDIPELLDDVVDAARTIPAYQGRNISLFISRVPAPFPLVRGDRDLLILAVYNLVENALKYTSQNDSVEVRALEDGKAVVVEVADSGGGIASEDLSRIFEELYRGSNARSTEGSGLGLALVNRIISLHGGQIDVGAARMDRAARCSRCVCQKQKTSEHRFRCPELTAEAVTTMFLRAFTPGKVA